MRRYKLRQTWIWYTLGCMGTRPRSVPYPIIAKSHKWHTLGLKMPIFCRQPFLRCIFIDKKKHPKKIVVPTSSIASKSELVPYNGLAPARCWPLKIVSVLLFCPFSFFRVIKSAYTYAIWRSYLTGVSATQMRWNLTNLNVIQMTWFIDTLIKSNISIKKKSINRNLL